MIEWAANPYLAWVVGGVAGLVAGFAIGAWVDARLRRREQRFDNVPAMATDREQIATRADALAQKVSDLLADVTERAQTARNTDFNNMREGQRRFGLRDNHTDVTARCVHRFHTDHLTEFWTVVSLAQKCISLDFGDLWQVSHGLGYHDIQKIPAILAKIAVGLRHPDKPDLPLRRPQLPTFQPTAPLPSPTPQGSPEKT